MTRLVQTEWEPDSCGCRIIFEVDVDLPAAQQVISFVAAPRICPYHASRGLSGKALLDALYTSDLKGENQRKNLAFAELKKVIPTVDYNEYQSKDSRWYSFDADGVLEITVPAKYTVTAQNKADLSVALDSKFGSGKVKIK
jgi:hypothetical protein